MAEHYSARTPSSRTRPETLSLTIRNRSFRFRTDAGVFSRGRLDRGTELLAEALDVGPCELVLDLGCGYGVLGIVAAKLSEESHVILTDVNERAAALAIANLKRNRVTNAEVRVGDLYGPVAGLRFDHIVCNPPIRAGRAVVDRIIEEAPDHLLDGGRLWLVVRTRQGAKAIRARIVRAFGQADVARRGSGYKVFCATKRPEGDRGESRTAHGSV